MKEGKYKGLPNIGATCYINSFLQTLFMTPEFRDGIYSWAYNEKIHPKPEDSILYQLQKLFAKLQMKSSDISIKGLVKSFQWQDQQAFDQQDIQEFNRVLFEALQKSFRASSKGQDSQLIKQLYEGELIHYTKCMECHNQSSRQETFQDLILVVKNIYEKIYSSSIELSIQRYIKPEILDENNLYSCQICNKKVRAERGVRFIKLPKLLNVVIQRFHFDYFTQSRNKINDKFTFPHILNFNHYFNGYDQIPQKINEDSSDYFIKQEAPPKRVMTKPRSVAVNKKVVSKAGTSSTQPSVAGKTKTKPSSNTKSFLQEMRKKKMQQQIYQNEDLIYVSGNAQQQPQTQQSNKNGPIVSQSTKNIQSSLVTNQIKSETSDMLETKKEEKSSVHVESVNHCDPPPPPPLTLETPSLADPYKNGDLISKNTQNQSITPQQQLSNHLLQKQKLDLERDEKLIQLQKTNGSLIEAAIKEGPLVYELYSILVHSGTSNAGHYYSYVKSFENGKWYVFNDQRVHEINVCEIEKTFGGTGLSNAYVLYYRLVDENPHKAQEKIPEYLRRQIEEEQEAFKTRQRSKLVNLENTLILKVYFQLGVKTIQIMKNSCLGLLYQKAKQAFNIETPSNTIESQQLKTQLTFLKQQNLRIRLFNPSNDTKLDTFRGKEDTSLEDLGIRSYQSFLLEVKGDSQQFEDYVAGFMSIRIALWKENTALESLDEKHIRLHKVSICRNAKMIDVEKVIKSKRSEFQMIGEGEDDSLCIIKRHQNDQFLYHQIINLSDYHYKTVDDVGIFEGQILFVEPDSEHLNWPRQFQNEINRITVKFNNIKNSQSQTITTDSRISLSDLMDKICGLLGQSSEEIIVRRGNRSGLQLKNTKATLKENRFINGTTLFLEKGIPAKLGQIRIQLYLASDASVSTFNKLHEFDFIADVPIDTTLRASDVKLQFKNILKKIKNIELQPEKMRIRQKVNDKMGKIYRERPMKEQQIIQKRQIAIQIKQDALEMRDFSIYVRVWDQLAWKLSPKYEFIVNKNVTMKDLSLQIYNCFREHDEPNAILPEDMDICRILSIHKFNIIDLVDMEYFGMESQASVFGQPMFVNSDGLLYIIKQTGIEPRELTKEEESIFGGKIKHYVRPTKGRSAPSASIKKEKGISIKVVEKEANQNEEKKEKQ